MVFATSNVLKTIEDKQDDEHGMQKKMRLLLLNWACKHGDQKCRQAANTELKAHLLKPKQYE